jgi:hypothetical protein
LDYKIWLEPTISTGEPEHFLVNDTISTRYRLENYYAYDDGSAEYSAQLTNGGNKLLYQFDIDTTQLRRFAGFDIFIPAFTVIENLRVNFFIYGHDEATNGPGELLYAMPSKLIARTPLNKFQRFTIPEGENEQVEVKDKIYIGWEAPVGVQFDVGLDKSNNTVDKIFTKTSGGWEHTDSYEGSLMIRPIFGIGVRIPTTVEDELVNTPLYPNPCKGEFFVDVRTEITGIINIAGQSISFDKESLGDQHKVTLHTSSPGMYLVKMRKGSKLFVRKLLVE